jgi:hypothetical protein
MTEAFLSPDRKGGDTAHKLGSNCDFQAAKKDESRVTEAFTPRKHMDALGPFPLRTNR